MKITDGLHAFLWRDPTSNNCNTYLIDGDKRILIDPGHRHLFSQVEMELREVGLSAEDIDLVIVTHAHPDHMEAVEMFAKPTLFAMGLDEINFLRVMAERYRGDPGILEPDFFLQEGELKVGRNTFQVVLAPGHSPGSICLYWPEQKVLFTGDVVFNQGIGRTDLPGGDGRLLQESIRRLAALDAEYLLSGHGEIISGAENVRANFQMIEQEWFGYLQ
jgi:glyoxylase-like metal-dependent hydrolase (beta-lactamase superfamily II)